MEFTLLAAAATGAASAWLAVKWLQRTGRLDPADRSADALIGAAAVGVFAGRIFEMISAGVNPVTNPFDVLLVRGGVDPAAASVAALVVVAWTYRRRPVILDALAPAALLGLAGWHAGCVWTGACLGTASGSLFGFTLPGSDVVRHPTELYAAALMAIGAIAVARMSRPFAATGSAIAVAAGVRLLTEPIRPSIGGGPVWFYAAALAAGLALVAWSMAGKAHRDSPTRAVLDRDGTAVGLDDAASDGQAESGAAGP